jgi:spoIIIJ-associated protein
VEWVEVSAKTVDEAIEQVLEQLGIDRDELEFEVLSEPAAGLFGRTRGEARVRARVAPKGKAGKVVKSPKVAKASSKSTSPLEAEKPATAGRKAAATSTGAQPVIGETRRPKASSSARAIAEAVGAEPSKPAAAPRSPRPPRDDSPVDTMAVVESASRFLSGLLSAAELEGTLGHRIVDEQTVEVSISGPNLGMFIGPKGQTLLAVQELLRTFVHHDTGGRSGRLMLDVAGYREKRRTALIAFTKQVAATVIETGERRALEPMSAVDRKVIHDTVNDMGTVSSTSEGEDPNRYVVLLPR